jgi:hypothetical protein
MFPKHPLRDFPDQANKAVEGKQIKMIEFHPFEFCDFFQNFTVIQTYSKKEKEYLYGVYLQQKLIGHIYTGEKYSFSQVNNLIDQYMPKFYDQMFEYSKEYPTIEYLKYDRSHYAFIFENALVKVSEI